MDRNIIKHTIVFITLILLCYRISAKDNLQVIHTFVALCDNKNQGIVPVPEKLGKGDDALNNLYWGALYGVKTCFKRSSSWKLITSIKKSTEDIIERCVFKYKSANVYLVADAYQGKKIEKAIIDFLKSIAGTSRDSMTINDDSKKIIPIKSSSNLLVYVGHDGLMDFQLKEYPKNTGSNKKDAMVIACMSKQYFSVALNKSGAHAILLTTGLLAPEAYILENAFEGWILKEKKDKIVLRAATAYNKYQKCGINAAKKLFTSEM